MCLHCCLACPLNARRSYVCSSSPDFHIVTALVANYSMYAWPYFDCGTPHAILKPPIGCAFTVMAQICVPANRHRLSSMQQQSNQSLATWQVLAHVLCRHAHAVQCQATHDVPCLPAHAVLCRFAQGKHMLVRTGGPCPSATDAACQMASTSGLLRKMSGAAYSKGPARVAGPDRLPNNGQGGANIPIESYVSCATGSSPAMVRRPRGAQPCTSSRKRNRHMLRRAA